MWQFQVVELSGRRKMRKPQKYQGLMKELEKAWKAKGTVVSIVFGELWAITPKQEEWLQQIPGKNLRYSSPEKFGTRSSKNTTYSGPSSLW